MSRRARSSEEFFENRFQKELNQAHAEGRLTGEPCTICGLRYPTVTEAQRCCKTLSELDAAGRNPRDYTLVWRRANGKKSPLPTDAYQPAFLSAYRRDPQQTFPDLLVELLEAAGGDCRKVYRSHAASLGVSRQRWGGWINSLRAHGYIVSTYVPCRAEKHP